MADPSNDVPAPRAQRKRSFRRALVAVLVLAVIAIAGIVYWRSLAWESTDDAQVDGFVFPISSRVAGHAVRVMVDDNQYVAAGTVLVQLDPTDFEVAVAVAKGTLANAVATAAALKTSVPITSTDTDSQISTAQADVDGAKASFTAAERRFDASLASLREAEANDLKAQDDLARYRPLAEKDEIPQQQYTTAVSAQKATAAAVEAARAAAAAAEKAVTQEGARIAQAHAALRAAGTGPQQVSVQRARARAAAAETERAAAALRQAQLNLQYTTVVAPIAGVVGRRAVHPGQNVSVGQQLMTVVPLDTSNIWVTANFKETQLKYMRPGQSATISVDAYGRSYQGRVLNIAGASGARYSLLPPENATGNYVKVVQRIPVRIVLDRGQDPEHLLRLGMSVEPSVRVR
jgi:membrane fusion protein (multidrug efflux system)